MNRGLVFFAVLCMTVLRSNAVETEEMQSLLKSQEEKGAPESQTMETESGKWFMLCVENEQLVNTLRQVYGADDSLVKEVNLANEYNRFFKENFAGRSYTEWDKWRNVHKSVDELVTSLEQISKTQHVKKAYVNSSNDKALLLWFLTPEDTSLKYVKEAMSSSARNYIERVCAEGEGEFVSLEQYKNSNEPKFERKELLSRGISVLLNECAGPPTDQCTWFCGSCCGCYCCVDQEKLVEYVEKQLPIEMKSN